MSSAEYRSICGLNRPISESETNKCLFCRLCKIKTVEKIKAFCLNGSLHLEPSTFQYKRDMLGQVLRVKGYYDVMIHRHHCEDVYDILLFFYKHF